jgi:tetratricopeptide (TPR) repeat protein
MEKVDEGIAYLEQEQWDQAIAAFNEAAQLDPNFPLTYAGLGYGYLNKGELESALQNFQTYLQLAPPGAADRADVEDIVQKINEVLAGQAAPGGYDVPEGKALFVFHNNSGEDFNVDVGPHLLEVPAGQTGQVVLDPGTYTWKGHSPGGGYYITDGSGNSAFEFSVAAGDVHETGVN